VKALIPIPLKVHRAGADPFGGVGTDDEDAGYGIERGKNGQTERRPLTQDIQPRNSGLSRG
jgi:hypothetical protein